MRELQLITMRVRHVRSATGLQYFPSISSGHRLGSTGKASLVIDIYQDYKLSTTDIIGDNVSDIIVGEGYPLQVVVKTYIYAQRGEYSLFMYSGNMGSQIVNYITSRK